MSSRYSNSPSKQNFHKNKHTFSGVSSMFVLFPTLVYWTWLITFEQFLTQKLSIQPPQEEAALCAEAAAKSKDAGINFPPSWRLLRASSSEGKMYCVLINFLIVWIFEVFFFILVTTGNECWSFVSNYFFLIIHLKLMRTIKLNNLYFCFFFSEWFV